MGILKKILVFSSAISLVLSQEAIASKRLSGAGATFPSEKEREKNKTGDRRRSGENEGE